MLEVQIVRRVEDLEDSNQLQIEVVQLQHVELQLVEGVNNRQTRKEVCKPQLL